MKIILYQQDFSVIEKIENINDIQLNGKDLKWSNGELKGINCSFIIVDDNVVIDDPVKPESILQDKTSTFKTINEASSIADLKNQIAQINNDIQELMNYLSEQGVI